MYVVDASVWVSRFIVFDIFHQPSLKWLEDRLSQEELVAAPAFLLVEVAGAVSRRTGDSNQGMRAASSVRQLPYSSLVPVDAPLVASATQLAAARRLRGADSLYVALAQRLGLPLITWDEQQRSQHGHGIIALTPQEALIGLP